MFDDNKLEIYLKNVVSGVVLITLNDYIKMMEVCDYIKDNFSIPTINYINIKDEFIEYLREQSESEKTMDLCIFNFEQKNINYDIVKSLNISRELFRKMGRVILIMPTYLSEQIRCNYPNLLNYISLVLDYNSQMEIPFEPIFATLDENVYTKEELYNINSVEKMRSRREIFKDKEILNNEKTISNEEISELVRDYISYFLSFHYKKLSYIEEQQYMKNLEVSLELINQSTKIEKNEKEQACYTILYKAGCYLAHHKYYKDALRIFDTSLNMLNKTEKHYLWKIETYEGLAYCHYYLAQIHEAGECLLHAINLLEEAESENKAWKYRLYNDYGACCYKSGDYEKALEIWKMCENKLYEFKAMDNRRNIRNHYNQLIAYMSINEHILSIENDWKTFFDNPINQSYINEYPMLFYQCNLADIWMEGIVLGNTKESLMKSEKILEYGKKMLTENNILLVINYYITAVLYKQLGEIECYKNSIIKAKKILKNCVQENQIIFFILQNS